MIRIAILALAVATAAPVDAASPRDYDGDLVYAGGLTASCAIAGIDVGVEETNWAIRGFYPREIDSAGASFAWSKPDAEIALLLDRGGARRLDLRLRSVRGLDLELSANGVAIGTRAIAPDFTVVSWTVPDGVLRPGVNRFRLRTGQPVRLKPDRRWLAVAVDYAHLDGATSGCPGTVRYITGDLPLELGVGAVWEASAILPPAAMLRLHLAGVAGSAVELYEARGHESRRIARLVMPPSGRLSEEVALASYGGAHGGVVALGLGPGSVVLRSAILVADDGPFAWRRDGGLFVAYAAFAVLVAVGLLILSRWRVPRWPGLIDVALVAAVAVAARYAYVAAYPGIDPDRFADAWEYLRRAHFLKDGSADAWSDSSWHGWQTWIRPPGYYLLLSLLEKPYDGGLNALSTLQGGFHVVIAVATYGLARTLFGRGAGLCAGLGYALCIEALVSASLVSSETLFLSFAAPGLWALAMLAKRPGFANAAFAGGLLGVATLVRSTPFFFLPVAAGLVVAAHGRRGREPAFTLLLFAGMAIIPWCVRNSIVRGVVSGVDDIAIPNFLFAHPDPEQISLEGLDLESRDGLGAYYATIKEANREHQFDGRRGIVRRGLVRMALDPLVTLRELVLSLDRCLGPLPEEWVSRHVGESHPIRVALLTDAINLSWFLMFALALAGIALSLRDRATWPSLLWIAYGILVVNVLFPRSDVQRYRFPTVPVLLAFAGRAVAEGAKRRANG